MNDSAISATLLADTVQVKTNVGHTEPTAGLASILKVVLSFEHNSIPPTIGISKLNPKSEWIPLHEAEGQIY